MSVICVLRQANGIQIQHFLSNPDEVSGFLYEDEELVEQRPDAETDLDKAWHGIHFLLTGSAGKGENPLCYLVRGGHTIGADDIGYGPARALLPHEVASLHTALSQVSPDDLRQRFDPEEMMKQKIYPQFWDSGPQADYHLSYLLDYYETLRTFVRETKDAGKGLIIFFN